ncbi:MAG: ATP-binding cassette domain-containing protein [Granulosicoccaceae bacterium]
MSSNSVKATTLPIDASQLRIKRANRLLLCIDKLSITGECTAIIGPNGAGKSLLIKTLAGLQEADSGAVMWAGAAPRHVDRRRVGLLLQRPVLLRRSAVANVIYALRAAGVQASQAKEQAIAALSEAGLGALAASPAKVLSGGEQQRLALARALALSPEVLFLDEPTASVDPISTQSIELMLKSATNNGCTTVLVSHDLGQVRRLAQHVILMVKGGIVEHSPVVRFFDQPESAQGRAYLAGDLLL